MYDLSGTFDPAAESAAFARVHNLAVALAELKAQGNTYGVQQLLPYFRQAIDEYKASGQTDPAYLTSFEKAYLSFGEGLAQVATWSVGKVVVPVLIGVAALYLLPRLGGK